MKRFENIGLLIVLFAVMAVMVTSVFVGIADYGGEGWGPMAGVLVMIVAATLVDRGYAAWKWWERSRSRGIAGLSEHERHELVDELFQAQSQDGLNETVRTALRIKLPNNWEQIVRDLPPMAWRADPRLLINQPHWGDLVGGDVAPMALGERIAVAAAGVVACGCRQLFDDQWTRERGAIRHVHYGDRGGIMVIKIREMSACPEGKESRNG